ncbi:MAG: glycosyltransferase family 39 protein [Bacteroidales bacterium]|nr:glycosyltransferase family 39 protein [Bacteroidales bacterium]
MRQTDSLSFASNYFNDGFNFFNPKLFNLKNIDGKAACEFPITYYLTALLYSVVGKHLFIQKLIHLIIAYYGAYCIFKLSNIILKDFFYAISVSLIVFTSTVFNYYSFNYLPDIPALGFVFSGWYFIYKYQINNKNRTLILSFLFFTLSGLIKVTYLINPIAIIIISLISLSFYRQDPLVYNSKKIAISGVIGITVVILWNIYILNYNDLYNSSSFNTKALPIWNLTQEKIASVWDIITNYWYSNYFYRHTFNLFYIIFAFQIIFIKRSDKKYFLQILILLSGNIAYFILFYTQFKHHDYYFLAFFPLFILLLISGLKKLQKITKNINLHYVFKTIILVIIILGIDKSRFKLTKRFNNGIDNYSRTGLLIQANTTDINNLNIDPNAKFIVAPDLCQNGGLFFLDKKGWNLEKSDHITVENINKYKNLGANYLLLATEDPEIISIGDSLGTIILKGNNISIFDLKNEIETNLY